MNIKVGYRHFLNSVKEVYKDGEAEAITQLIFEDCFNLKKADILKNGEKAFTEEAFAQAQTLLNRLMSGEPVQYVIGHTTFAGLRFMVGKGILIPRPETAMLVELASEDISKNASTKILDIGTGSGSIAIALKKKFPKTEVHACDISEEALAWAQENAANLSADVQLHSIDILNTESRTHLPVFDLIISNPPYIPIQEKENLEKNVREFEPALALFVPNEDPFIFYEAIANFGKSNLKDDGVIWVETHCDYAINVKSIFEEKEYECLLMQDEFGKDRYVRAVNLFR